VLNSPSLSKKVQLHPSDSAREEKNMQSVHVENLWGIFMALELLLQSKIGTS
jgi:hypothetical protein